MRTVNTRKMALSSALYSGSTLHTRRSPELNRFSYRLYLAYVDLTELRSRKLDMWPFFSSRTAWALTSALESDHCIHFDRQLPLEERVRAIVLEKTGSRPTGPIRMLTGLRILGMEFNPVSFFFVFNKDDTEVVNVVAEVNNIPWFEQHSYVLSPEVAQFIPHSVNELRPYSGHAKVFHVSPFIDTEDISYSWLIGKPDAILRMKIGLERKQVPFFMASLHLRRHSFGVYNFIKFQFSHPVQTAKVVIAIMWEAAKLFRRGFAFVPHPNEQETVASKLVASTVELVLGIREKIVQLVAFFQTGKREC